MLFDLSMTELMLIGLVALVVIGPKDLPKALRVAGFWVKKARTLSREFQTSVEQMMREAELDEMRKEFKKASEFNIEKEFHNTIDPTGSLAESLQPPELPKFSDADMPVTPSHEIQPGATAQASREETSISVPAIEPPHEESADPPRSEPALPSPITPTDPRNGPVSAEQQGVEEGRQHEPAAPGFPPSRN
jgi:sec-independent protein translocase protein TatB